jgi:hypothetical protein
MTLPSYSKAQAEQAIVECLAANEAAVVDRLDRLTFLGPGRMLRLWLGLARNVQTPEHYFGENWRGPSLADVIAQCEQIRRINGLGVASLTRRRSAGLRPEPASPSRPFGRLSANARKG